MSSTTAYSRAKKNALYRTSVAKTTNAGKYTSKITKKSQITENDKKHKEEISSSVKCRACNNSLWWCMGCGSGDKMTGMLDIGLTENIADQILMIQYGSCSGILIPCFVCNRSGKKLIKKKGFSLCPSFWNNIPNQLPKDDSYASLNYDADDEKESDK